MSTKLPAEYKRMPDYMADPFHLAAEWMRFPGPKKAIPYLPDPLAGQLRSILAVNDTRGIRAPPDRDPLRGGPRRKWRTRRPPRHDHRSAPPQDPWMGDVYSDYQEKFSPALLASLAEHFANLFVLPQR